MRGRTGDGPGVYWIVEKEATVADRVVCENGMGRVDESVDDVDAIGSFQKDAVMEGSEAVLAAMKRITPVCDEQTDETGRRTRSHRVMQN